MNLFLKMLFLCLIPTATCATANTISSSLSNESDSIEPSMAFDRTVEFPTQIIRVSGNLEGQQLECKPVIREIEAFFLKQIPKEEYLYNTIIYCQYDPKTNLAVDYRIESIFDPINDVAVDHLKHFLEQYNGKDFFGTPLKVESSKGMIIALSIAAGIKKDPDKPPFLEYRRDQNSLYFKTNFAARNSFYADIFKRFYSNDPEQILPFLETWFFTNAGSLYQKVLAQSNHVELQPERIFIMEQGEHIFVSRFKLYFKHHCDKYENHRCLNVE